MKRPAPKPEPGLRTQWSGFRPMYDFWGNELKRFYQLETLAGATDRLLREKDRFILPSIQSVMGPSDLHSLSFELFQEGRFQFIFRIQAVNTRRKRASFGFVVAKNAQEASAVAKNEHRILRELHPRAPLAVVQPFRGGAIYLPDRYHRASHGREIYAYVTQWLHGYDELGINKNLQCIANIQKVHTFTLQETEMIKGHIAETFFRTFDPKTRTAMALPEIASGDFVINWSSKKGTPRQAAPKEPFTLKLIACRRMLAKTSPARMLELLLRTSWEWNGRRFCLAPHDPETLHPAMVKALGSAPAGHAVVQCLENAPRNNLPPHLIEYLEALRQLMVK